MKLLVKKILTNEDFQYYLKLVESFDIINPFYKILGPNNTGIIDDKLRYFVFLNDRDEVLVLMPFILRNVPYIEEGEVYYDVISPYGYSGPLFNDNMSRGYLIHFWEHVDAWYRENRIISEFIRFSLNHNFQFYSGILIPTLTNVKGELIDEAEQWQGFKQKVRNNYRKSLDHNLKAEFYRENITDQELQLFYDIYISTMERIGAGEEYFYSLEYFRNVIKLSKHNFVVVLIWKDDIPISTELILIAGDTLYSFLGGTEADYFNCRPNDFLKIEVMKWAREKGFKFYLLGGGRTDGDSLYQYKKSFFPEDKDVIYYTGRKIVNEHMYEKLDKIMNATVVLEASNNKEGANNTKGSFFPAYRRNYSKKR